jgi:lipid-A-disaccharide synthase
MPTRIMIIAGEASGDLHGGKLVQALKRLDPSLELFGVGGDTMAAAGVSELYHANQLAYVGFVEVAKHYTFFRRVFHDLLNKVREQKPDLVVLIDYPGFNLRFAKAVKALGVKTFYYIAPQVWAWRQGRAAKMARFIDRLAVIFPFEVPFFSRHGISTHFVGHPLVEGLQFEKDVEPFMNGLGLDPARPLVALLPGSRMQEVQSLLPVMVEAASLVKEQYPYIQFAVSRAATISRQIIEGHTAAQPWIKIVDNATYDLLHAASAGLVASGTATLETACFGVPFAIVYKVSPASFAIGKRLVKIPHIGLVNVVAGKKIVNEYLQKAANAATLKEELLRLLFDVKARHSIRHELAKVKNSLGEPGASERTARLVLEMVA